MKFPAIKFTQSTLHVGIMLTIAMGYFIFLIATWIQFQNDRANRELKINELLDRIPAIGSTDATSPREEATSDRPATGILAETD